MSGRRRDRKGVKYNEDGSVKSCVFCDIIADGTRCVYSDEHVAVFPSRAGDAEGHLLAVPKRHIRSIHSLPHETDDASMMLRALDVREKILTPEELEDSVAVFHRPPFTSIDHLHLHILHGRYKNWAVRLKHTPGPWRRWNMSFQAAERRCASKM